MKTVTIKDTAPNGSGRVGLIETIRKFNLKELSGSWSLEDIQRMVLEFNSLQPNEDGERGKILKRLCSANLIKHVFHSACKLAMVPMRLIHFDLVVAQLNRKARQHVIEQHFKVSGKIISHDIETAWVNARSAAESSGKLPAEYVRKYDDNPSLVCDVEKDHTGIYIFVVTGSNLHSKIGKEERRLPVKRIVQLQLDETDRITGLSKYVDLKMIC